jgi:arylsulfatase A-like enzyme
MLTAFAIAVVTVCSAFLFRSFSSDKFKIFWDERLIKGKADYLGTPIKNIAGYKRPNVIIILADDLGITDLSSYGNKVVSTPNIDGIAKNGVRFSEGYISSPVCSPSRDGLITGRYQERFGHEFQPEVRYLKNMAEYYGIKMMPKFKPLTPIKELEVPSTADRLRQGLPPSEITLAELLKKYDYATAIIGKWHLGAADFAKPCARGFDYQYGFYEAFTLYSPLTDTSIQNTHVKREYMDEHEWETAAGRKGNCAILRNCSECLQEDKYLTNSLTDEAINWIGQNQGSPFFLYLPYNAPHAPLQVPKSYYRQFANIKDPVKRTYAAMIKSLDDQVGRLLQYVDSLGIADNTIIFFLSDNGGAVYNGTTDNTPYRGGKLTNFEGGIKIPFMMEWKGHINPGTVYNYPVISLDIFATVASTIGIDLPTDRKYDGVDLVPYVNGQVKTAPHQALYWRSEFNKAIRKGDWKLIVNEYDNTSQLYDLAIDSTEMNNLSMQKPEVVKQLTGDLDGWEQEMIKPLWPRVVNYVYRDNKGKYVFAF